MSYDPFAGCGRDENDMTLTIAQSGNTFTGTMAWIITQSFFPPDVGLSNSVAITGTVKGNALSYSFGPDKAGGMWQVSATFTSTKMTGVVLQNSCPSMTFTLTRQ